MSSNDGSVSDSSLTHSPNPDSSGVADSRKVRTFTPDCQKDNKYWERRRRNNEAARRSREKRRNNDVVMDRRVAELTLEKKTLQNELYELKVRFGLIPAVSSTSQNSTAVQIHTPHFADSTIKPETFIEPHQTITLASVPSLPSSSVNQDDLPQSAFVRSEPSVATTNLNIINSRPTVPIIIPNQISKPSLVSPPLGASLVSNNAQQSTFSFLPFAALPQSQCITTIMPNPMISVIQQNQNSQQLLYNNNSIPSEFPSHCNFNNPVINEHDCITNGNDSNSVQTDCPNLKEDHYNSTANTSLTPKNGIKQEGFISPVDSPIPMGCLDVKNNGFYDVKTEPAVELHHGLDLTTCKKDFDETANFEHSSPPNLTIAEEVVQHPSNNINDKPKCTSPPILSSKLNHFHLPKKRIKSHSIKKNRTLASVSHKYRADKRWNCHKSRVLPDNMEIENRSLRLELDTLGREVRELKNILLKDKGKKSND